jgi:chorismate mutase
MPTFTEITRWRRRIDELDAALLRLLNLRADCALQLGRLKRAQAAPLHAPGRERRILARLRRLSGGPLTPAAVERIYRGILDESLRLQRQSRARESAPTPTRGPAPVNAQR